MSYLLAGRVDKGREVFQRLLGLRNDLGLLSEEYDTHTRRLIGNFPQALTHLALVNTALDLHSNQGPTHRRAHPGRQTVNGPSSPRPSRPPQLVSSRIQLSPVLVGSPGRNDCRGPRFGCRSWLW